jgi:hypothetical protein
MKPGKCNVPSFFKFAKCSKMPIQPKNNVLLKVFEDKQTWN